MMRRMFALAGLLILWHSMPLSLSCHDVFAEESTGNAKAKAASEDWPRWRGPRGDGTWRGPKLPDAFPPKSLPPRWSVKIGPGYSGVTVSGGRVYTMDRQSPADAPRGEGFERIVCFDANTGRKAWEHRYPASYVGMSYDKGPRASVTVFGGMAYTLGASGHVHCLDAATGKVRWKIDTVKELGAKRPIWGFAASPVIYKGNVLVHVGARPVGCVVALNRKTGDVVWRGGKDPAGYATPVFFERDGEQRMIVWTPKHITAMDPNDGEVLWKLPYEIRYGVSIHTPIVHGDVVFISGYWHGPRAIALGEQRGDAKFLWQREKNLNGLMAQPLYKAGYAYLLDKDNGVTCFHLESGKKLWDDAHKLTPRGRNPQVSMVALLDHGKTSRDEKQEDAIRILALNADGELIHAELSPRGIKEFGRVPVVGKTWAHPAYAGQYVYARDDAKLVCVPLSP